MSTATCEACGHEHAGPGLGSICIGCPCDARPGLIHFPSDHLDLACAVWALEAVTSRDRPELAWIWLRGSGTHVSAYASNGHALGIVTLFTPLFPTLDKAVSARFAKAVSQNVDLLPLVWVDPSATGSKMSPEKIEAAMPLAQRREPIAGNFGPDVVKGMIDALHRLGANSTRWQGQSGSRALRIDARELNAVEAPALAAFCAMPQRPLEDDRTAGWWLR